MNNIEINTIAICRNESLWKHSGDWSEAFIEFCIQNSIKYDIINPYATDIINRLDTYSVVLWGIQNYLYADLLEARNILRIAENKGKKVFPCQNTIWHFDDKIAEMYAFQSVNSLIPNSWVFYLLEDAISFFEDYNNYPIVAKLRCGSGASNVKLLKSKSQAISYAKRMFSKGYDPSPNLFYKVYSKAQSSRDWKTLIKRIKKIPEFLYTRSRAKQMPRERGYCYLQSYIQNEGYDIKVVVVGDKLSFLVRNVRKGDFRASGGGQISYDKKYISKQIIDSAFETADKLKLQCIGFDYVVDKLTLKGYIIEMCYGFDYNAILDACGYFNRNAEWINEPLNVPHEVVSNLLNTQ